MDQDCTGFGLLLIPEIIIIIMWNDLPSEIIEALSLNRFKSLLVLDNHWNNDLLCIILINLILYLIG